MKFYLIILLTIFSQIANAQEDFRKKAPQPAPVRIPKAGAYQQEKLANGLQLIVVENNVVPQIYVQVISDYDPVLEKEKAGVSQLTGQLLSAGTMDMSKSDFDAAVDIIGANFSTNERGGEIAGLSRYSARCFELLSNAILKPGFKAEEFEKIKKKMASELIQAKDDPDQISTNVSNKLFFGENHPFGEVVTERTVSSVTVDDCKAFYKENFSPAVTYILVVGNIDFAKAKALTQQYFGGWQGVAPPKRTYTTAAPISNPKVSVVNKEGAVQSTIVIGHMTQFSLLDPDYLAVTMANNILGGSNASARLFKNIREDKGYTYGAYSKLTPNVHGASFEASASVRTGVTDSSIIEFIKEIGKMGVDKITPEELTLNKNVFAGNYARSLENPGTIGKNAMNIIKYKLPTDYYDTYLKRLEALTIEEVQQAYRRVVHPFQCHILVVGDKEKIESSLLKFDDNGKLDFYDAFGNPIKEKKEIPAGLTAKKVIENACKAYGGITKLENVQSSYAKWGMTVMNHTMINEMWKKSPNKFKFQVKAGDMVMQEMIYKDGKGEVVERGQQRPADQSELNEMAISCKMFEELEFLKNDSIHLELKGIVDEDGKSMYRIVANLPGGMKKVNYYNVESGLKEKSEESKNENGVDLTTTMSYSDYKEVMQIKVPHKVIITGAMPMALEMNASEILFNTEIPDKTFQSSVK